MLLKWFDKRPVALLGMGFYKGALKEFSLGMLTGLIMAAVCTLILWLAGLASFSFNGFSTDMFLYLIVCLILLVISASYEEILFRGYIFQSLLEGTNLWITLGVFSLLFGASHIDNGPTTVAFAVVAGVFLGLLYFKTRTLWVCIGFHFMWNFTEALIFGMGVEESGFLRKSLFSYRPLESDFIVGAEIMTLIIQGLFMIMLTLIIWKFKWLKPAEYNVKLWPRYPLKYGTEPSKID